MKIKCFENFIDDFNTTNDWFPYSCKIKRKKFQRKEKYDNNRIYTVESIDFKDKKITAHHSATPKGYVRGPGESYDGWNDNRIHVNFDEVDIFPYKECDCPVCLEKISKKYNL